MPSQYLHTISTLYQLPKCSISCYFTTCPYFFTGCAGYVVGDEEQLIIGRLRIRLSQASWAGAGPELGNKRRFQMPSQYLHTISTLYQLPKCSISCYFTTCPYFFTGCAGYVVGDEEQLIIGRLRIRLSQASWAGAGPELGKNQMLETKLGVF